MEKKTDIVRRLVGEGKYKEALAIAKGFRIGLTKDDLKWLQIAHEMMVDAKRRLFYEKMDYVYEDCLENAKFVLHKNILHEEKVCQ